MAEYPAIINISGKLFLIHPTDSLRVGSGVTTESGNLSIDSFGGKVAVNPLISTNLVFDNLDHTITATQATANGLGVNLLVTSAGGGSTSTSSAAGAGGVTTLQGGGGGDAGGSSGAAGAGGGTFITGGSGGNGTATGLAGAGGGLNIIGGSAGADNGFGGANGGQVDIDGGLSTGAGVNGTITIGINNATSLTIGRSGVTTTGNGNWTFTNPIAADATGIVGATTYSCVSGRAVGDPVYISAANTATLADATDGTKIAFGLISSKPTATTCYVRTVGDIGGFVGLTAGSIYYLAVGGGITATAPVGAGNSVQKLGFARNTTTLIINVSSYNSIV